MPPTPMRSSSSYRVTCVQRSMVAISYMERIRALLDEALAANLGSAAAVSVGDSGREVFRYLTGTTRRVPDAGPAITENTPFDLASVTKPMSTRSEERRVGKEG